MVKKCSNCGTSIKDVNNAAFCPSCGKRFDSLSVTTLKVRNPLWYGVAALIPGFIIGIICIFTEEINFSEIWASIIIFFSLCSLTLLVVCNHQWCNTINVIAQKKIINPYINLGMIVGGPILLCCLRMDVLAFFAGDAIMLEIVLRKLNMAYKGQKTIVPACWGSSLNFARGILAAWCVCYFVNELLYEDFPKMSNIFYCTAVLIFSCLVYSIQFMFNFVICHIADKKENIVCWEKSYESIKIFGALTGFMITSEKLRTF